MKSQFELADRNRYRGRKTWNRAKGAFWSVVITGALLVGGYYLVKTCTPWLSQLWQTIE